MMERLINRTKKITGIIEEDSNLGFYLYIYDNLTKKCIADYLQDTLDQAKAQGEEDYHLKLDAWIKEKASK